MNKEAFLVVTNLYSQVDFKYFYGWKPTSISLQDQILITLMKLRLNLEYVDLKVRFITSKHTVGNIILTFIHLLQELLFECAMKVPSQSKNVLNLSNCFTNFKNCRIVLVCTEFRYEILKCLNEQKDTYSNSEHGNTLKGMIGVAPNGTITYTNKLYPVSTSDKMIVQQSGTLDIFYPEDLILVDKGFLLKDVVPNYVSVNIQPFLCSPQFIPNEVEKYRNIANARIHIERAIRRLKLYRILNFIPIFPKLFQLCAALTNYSNPIISEVTSTYQSLHSDSNELIESDDDISDYEPFAD